MTAHQDRSPDRSRPRRPALFGPAVIDTFVGGPDPAQRIEAAHLTATALINHGRTDNDPALTARLVALADDHGLDEIAELWSARPAETLPGALWRIYALRAGIRGDPEGMARAFDDGRHRAPVHEAVAGVAEPPGPVEVQVLADAILAGAFNGDLAVALERAAAFCHVVATGWAVQADDAVDLIGLGQIWWDDASPTVSPERASSGPPELIADGELTSHDRRADPDRHGRADAADHQDQVIFVDPADGVGRAAEPGESSAGRLTRQAAGLARTGTELELAAKRWRAGELS